MCCALFKSEIRFNRNFVFVALYYESLRAILSHLHNAEKQITFIKQITFLGKVLYA
jgi:hypothetical protein